MRSGKLAKFCCAMSLALALPVVSAESQVSFAGGRVKQIKGATQPAPTTRSEGAFQALAGASATFTVPAGTKDLFLVTFSAECQLTGGTDGVDWLAVEARLDGTPMNPAAGTDFAFCSDLAWNSSSHTWLAKPGGGAHTVQIFWALQDVGAPSTLTGRLDDWTLELEVAQ